MRRAVLFLFFICLTFVGYSQYRHDEIIANIDKAKSVYRLYPTTFPKLTPAPKGYKPFYISHYGRHGSRYIEFQHEFDNVIDIFDKAKAENKLTPYGEQVVAKLNIARKTSFNRAGDLTPLGIEQHKGIAKRMYHNYPTIFRHNPTIRAVSTIVPRVLLSMNSFTNELLRNDPKLNITIEGGINNMPYLNPYSIYNDPKLSKYIDTYRYPVAAWSEQLNEFRDKIFDDSRILSSLFSADFFSQIPDRWYFIKNLYQLAISLPNTPIQVDLYDVFQKEECYSIWRLLNMRFYFEKANSGIGDGFLSKVPTPLLADIIRCAEQAIKDGGVAVNLRFGHDSVIMALLATMNIEGWCGRAENIADIERVFYDFDVPMASNLQFVFYRNSKGDILVKGILNESIELKFPIQSDCKPYYHWTDMQNYYNAIIDQNRDYIFH